MTWTSAEDKLSWGLSEARSLSNLMCFKYQVTPLNPSGLEWPSVWYYVIIMNSLPRGHTVCAITSHEPLHYSSLYRSLTSFDPSSSLGLTRAPPRLLFSIFHGHSVERVARIFIWFQKRKTPESSSLSGAYVHEGKDWIPGSDKAVHGWLFKRNQFKCFYFLGYGLLYL